MEDYFHVSGFEHCVDPAPDWDDFSPRVVESTQRLLDCFAEANVRGTFFILGWGGRAASLDLGARAIRAAGHEIGCHTGYSHRLIYEQTPEEFRQDLRLGLHVLQNILGERITCLSAAEFLHHLEKSLWALDVLIEEGITLDSSIYPTHHDRYGIPDTPLHPHRIERAGGSLWEFPPPVWRCLGYPLPVGGGGYFRLFPYALTRLALKRINAEGRPFAAYLHPWEIDPEQPRLNPGLMRGFRHYVNLNRTESRLRQMLEDFDLGTLTEAAGPCGSRAALGEPSESPMKRA